MILVFWSFRAFLEPWSIFLFLHMGEWLKDAGTGIFSVRPQFLITDPLPRVK